MSTVETVEWKMEHVKHTECFHQHYLQIWLFAICSLTFAPICFINLLFIICCICSVDSPVFILCCLCILGSTLVPDMPFSFLTNQIIIKIKHGKKPDIGFDKTSELRRPRVNTRYGAVFHKLQWSQCCESINCNNSIIVMMSLLRMLLISLYSVTLLFI